MSSTRHLLNRIQRTKNHSSLLPRGNSLLPQSKTLSMVSVLKGRGERPPATRPISTKDPEEETETKLPTGKMIPQDKILPQGKQLLPDIKVLPQAGELKMLSKQGKKKRGVLKRHAKEEAAFLADPANAPPAPAHGVAAPAKATPQAAKAGAKVAAPVLPQAAGKLVAAADEVKTDERTPAVTVEQQKAESDARAAKQQSLTANLNADWFEKLHKSSLEQEKKERVAAKAAAEKTTEAQKKATEIVKEAFEKLTPEQKKIGQGPMKKLLNKVLEKPNITDDDLLELLQDVDVLRREAKKKSPQKPVNKNDPGGEAPTVVQKAEDLGEAADLDDAEALVITEDDEHFQIAQTMVIGSKLKNDQIKNKIRDINKAIGAEKRTAPGYTSVGNESKAVLIKKLALALKREDNFTKAAHAKALAAAGEGGASQSASVMQNIGKKVKAQSFAPDLGLAFDSPATPRRARGFAGSPSPPGAASPAPGTGRRRRFVVKDT